MPRPLRRYIRTTVAILMGGLVFAISWFYRFNDPGGQFAGLTDDHFFYLVRGWQLLYGDLPVRDFVDHGAPLFYYVGAAVQYAFGRGTLAEVAFCVTVLSAAASLTFFAAVRASGAITFAAVAILVHILLGPRFYNYPKILIYAAAIPLLWGFADRRDAWSRAWIAVVAVIGFLLRHDHGAFVAIGFLTLLALLNDMPWRLRVHHAAWFAGLLLALLAPYLLFIEMNGGLRPYFSDALAWAERDRGRTPVVWPGLFDNPDGVSQLQSSDNVLERAVAIVRDNFVAWVYYLELALPLIVIALIAVSRDGFQPSWPRAVPKIIVVSALALVLNAGFLRSPLEARLADPSVPHTILLAWLMTATVSLLQSRASLRDNVRRWALPLRFTTTLIVASIVFVLIAGFSANFVGRLARTRFIDTVDANTPQQSVRLGRVLERARDVSRQLRTGWQPSSRLRSRDNSDLITLARYVNTCTRPQDRVFVQPYIPQVLALAERAFAGGHADLRPGFFETVEAQRLTLARLGRQSVPIVLLESDDAYRNFRESFPLIVSYLDEKYTLAGTNAFSGLRIQLFVAKDASPRGLFAPLGWPCFADVPVARWSPVKLCISF